MSTSVNLSQHFSYLFLVISYIPQMARNSSIYLSISSILTIYKHFFYQIGAKTNIFI